MVGGRRETFRRRLEEAIESKRSHLCVGLDPISSQVPAHLGGGLEGVRRFCLELIDATAPVAAAFKPNSAFFEALGASGWELLREVVAEAGRRALVVVDAKRGDIGNTSAAYAAALYDGLGADACTVHPYLGLDGIQPFLAREDRLAFILCRTSNPGAADLQDLRLAEDGQPLYLHLARAVAEWDHRPPGGTAGLVVGATWPQELERVRAAAPELPLLVPGVGAQGGDLEGCVARLGTGRGPYLISISRGVAGASAGADFGAAAARAATGYRDRMLAAEEACE